MKLRDLVMKTHKKTRIILIVIAALVAILSSIAIITTTANKNNANAASVGAGSSKTGFLTSAGAADAKGPDVWWYGDEDASIDGIRNVFNSYYGYNRWRAYCGKKCGWGIFNNEYWPTTINNALSDCSYRNGGKCEGARLVALGWPQFKCSLHNNHGGYCPDGGSGQIVTPQTFCDKTVTIQGNDIELNKKIGNTNTSVCDAINNLHAIHTSTKTVAVVLSKDEYQHSGWKPVFQQVTSDAYANKVQTTSTQLEPCVYAYSMQTIGVDGYVRNYATAQHTYKTAYGKFLDDVGNGKYNGSYYYVGNSSKQITDKANLQKTMNDKLISDYKIACDAANKEVDNYNIESEEKPDKTGSTIISGKEFLQRYAKGGVYKVKRSKLNGVLNYKTTSVKYYKSTSSYYKLTDWRQCTNEIDGTWIPGTNRFDKCNYWGQNKPGLNVYPGKYNITHTGWSEINIKDTGNFFDHNIDKDNSILYYIGYIDENGKSQGDEKIKAKNATEWNTHMNAFKYGFTPNDDPASFSNTLHPIKQEYTSWIHVWHQDFMNILCNKTDFDNYKTALKKMYGADIYTDISKVSDGSKYQGQLKSPVIDSDFANEHNRAEVTNTWLKNGEKDGIKDPNTDNWYSNSDFDMRTYKFNIAASQVADTMEPFDRVLYTVSTDLTTDNKLDMAHPLANIKSVVGDTSADTLLTKAKSVNSAYNTDNFINWYNSAAYDASLDPVYTKECPYDCTDDAGGTASSSNDNVVNGKTEDGASPSASGLKKKTDERATGDPRETGAENDYGVRVRTTDSKGNLKDSSEDVNTANMTFFRNNTWNRFRVDIWYPIFKDGLTAASASDSIRGISETKGSQTAKSTTIIRNGGTPWYVKGNDSTSGFATEMKVIKSLDNGDSIDGSNARLFNPEIDKITPGNQISLGSVTARGANVVELPYEATAFAIRSMWATDPNIGKLEFNIKWEFDSKNNLDVPTKFTVGNTADSVSSTSTPQYAISDGKCYGNQNKGQSYDYDLINLFHDNTGAGTIDNLDKEFNDNFGKFTIQFVRSTAE